MARRACNGGGKVVDASTAAVDTNGYGIVTILMVASAASATLAVTVGDTSTPDTTPETTLIDPDTGETVDLASLTLAAKGDTRILSYIGDKRYIKATGTNATALVYLEEPRMTTPFE